MTEGTRLLAGRYEVGALIGHGGMADVHLGTDTRLGPTRGHQAPEAVAGHRPEVPHPVPRGSAEGRADGAPHHRAGLRRRRGDRPRAERSRDPIAVHRHGVRRRPAAQGHHRRWPARAQGSHPDHLRRAHRARVQPPRTARAPRHQAGQHHGHPKRPGEGDGLRHRQGRVRQLRHGGRYQRDPRHRPVLLSRAGARRIGGCPHRPVLDRRRAVRTAHRAGHRSAATVRQRSPTSTSASRRRRPAA